MEILNIFNTLTLKQIFWKTRTFFKKLDQIFLVESTKIENASFPYKTTISEANAMLRQIDWWVQIGPITKNRILPVTTLFFGKFSFNLRTSNKQLIWCTSDLIVHITIFCIFRSFIWQCFFFVRILENSLRHNLANKQLQYTYCPISHEVKATRQWNLGNLEYNNRKIFLQKLYRKWGWKTSSRPLFIF